MKAAVLALGLVGLVVGQRQVAAGAPGKRSPDSASPDSASPDSASPDSASPEPDAGPPSRRGAEPDADLGEPEGGEVIEVTGQAPAAPGSVQLDAAESRSAPGALGEPLRALAMLPGVATSVAALGYPVIRGALPGESRFSFDGIELPMLYHFLVGNQVIHPALLGTLELRGGGYGAEHGRLLGGLVTMDAAAEPRDTRTELRATLVEVGGLQTLSSKRTSAIVALRAGTLAAIKLIDARAELHYLDQQLRVVHRLGNGDRLVLTGLGAFDYSHVPPEEKVYVGFHRFDARWERRRPGWTLRAGVQTELDFAGVGQGRHYEDIDGDGIIEADEFGPEAPLQSSRSLGVRPYGALAWDAAPWLTLRGGADARYRAMRTRGEPLFEPYRADLAPARSTDAAGLWLAGDLRLGRVTLTPGVRADTYHVDAAHGSRRTQSVDVRLAGTVQITDGVRAEVAGGTMTAPPQPSFASGSIALGPLPTADGIGATVGMSRSTQAEVGVRAMLPGDLEAKLTAFWRETHHAVDFGLIDKDFSLVGVQPCDVHDAPSRYDYTNIKGRAVGLEAMIRRRLGHRTSGWVSYTLAKLDRRLPMGGLPNDLDQRHTINAAVQTKVGKWQLGAGVHVHTGRPSAYPRIALCPDPFSQMPGATSLAVVEDPTRLRRLPTTWRIDVRAQRDFRFASWNARLVIELQNVALRPEAIQWALDSEDRIVADGITLPVPMIGFEAEF